MQHKENIQVAHFYMKKWLNLPPVLTIKSHL